MDRLAPGDPRTLGSYRLLGRLGAGGMGRVYLARSDRGRTVAVKLVHPDLAGQESFRHRFRQEVAAARRVGGEWTAPVLDADTEAEVPWVATGYIAGPSLQRVARDFGPLPERSVRVLGAGLARALQAIHGAGIVHRDLKPSNVLITIDGPRVIDFGIARALDSVTDGGLTRTGATVGSPGFMSPEQVRGDRVTPASDVFCLGSVLAYAASGRMPFGGESSGVHALMFRIAQEQPDLTDVPEGLRPLISAFLAKDPADRPTPEEVVDRTGVEGLLADLRATESWLPGGLVAQLGRHAIRLLDAEDPDVGGATPAGGAAPAGGMASPTAMTLTGSGPRPGTPVAAGDGCPPADAADAAGAPTPADPAPTPTPGPTPATALGGRPGRSRAPLVIAAVVAAAALVGGGAYYVVQHRNDAGNGEAAQGGEASSTPDASGHVPKRFLGTWNTSFRTPQGHQTRRIVISQGRTGADIATITGEGMDTLGRYRCVWTAALTAEGTADGPLKLGPSVVTVAEPSGSACQSGAASYLTMQQEGTFLRGFIDTDRQSGEQSLTYSRVK
ncbi:serine/threonine-protein kinase [Streptomyces sp. XD-27]|uniref:serine/threonine-protein kinase n=1 Tax=Streptomyces sp. XD-27 TaxID=3062779 RepID=UPI0026F47A55|nr:serine/threonine-protein kinase [Streptomyces sp. XD-27]WKX71232.1 serine/threonine-protein kinase [Streptomyces sp. XD-27]